VTFNVVFVFDVPFLKNYKYQDRTVVQSYYSTTSIILYFDIEGGTGSSSGEILPVALSLVPTSIASG